MALTVFCALMLLAFLGCLLATGSLHILLGAVLLVFLLALILRRPISYSENRWIFVFYRWTLRVVPATERITGNPNAIVFYRQSRTDKRSFVAVSAGEEQIVSGMTLYPYRGHRLLVLFPVPSFLHSLRSATFGFAVTAAAALTALAAIGFVPYLRLRRTDALLANTVPLRMVHTAHSDVIDDASLDNVLLICRDAENKAALLEILSFRHGKSAVQPLYLNTGLYAEITPGCYESIRDYSADHSAAEIAMLVEEQYYLRIRDAVCLDSTFLETAAASAGGLQISMTSAEIAQINALMQAADGSSAVALPYPASGDAAVTACTWAQALTYLRCDGARAGEAVYAQRECALTDALFSVFRQLADGSLPYPAAGMAETSFTPDRLYQLADTVRSDSVHYDSAYRTCTAPDAIARCCLPRQVHYRALEDDLVYAAPGVLRQYVIRLLYY